LAALSVAMFIYAAAGRIGWRAVHEIITPHQGPHWATLPLLAGIVGTKLWFSRRVRSAGELHGSTALGAEALHHSSDAVTSAAAFIGIAIAIVGGRGYEAADDWAALLACAFIAANGVMMAGRALRDVMDEAVPEAFEQEVRSLALRVPGVQALDKCRVRKSGLSHLVDIQVRVDGELTVTQGHAIAHGVKDALLESPLHVSDVSVHIEPMK
jgi:cation diffusion facilitator family transporter